MVLDYIKNQKIDAKIIKINGFKNQETEAVKKILRIAFSQTRENVITLKSIDSLFAENQKKP